MASANAAPITGKERIRIIQGGWDTWIDRGQFTSLLALPSLPNVGPRPYTTPTAILGTETISAWQDGTKITLNAADITTFLAGSGAAPPHPDPNLATTFTGNELIMGHQSGWRVAWSIADIGAIQNGTLPAGFSFVTTGASQDYVTTNSDTNRIIARNP